MANIITTNDLRDHLGLPEGQDEALLTAKIEAAQAAVEQYVGSTLDDTAAAPLKEAVRQLAAHLYENREGQALPLGVFDLVGPYRTEWTF